MKVYYDRMIAADKDIFNDSFKLKTEADDFIIGAVATLKPCSKSGAGNIDIGANPSAEEEGEQYEDNPDTVTDLDIKFEYNLEDCSSQFPDKKSVIKYLKTYTKNLAEHIKNEDGEDACKTFKDRASKNINAFLSKFTTEGRDISVYSTEDFDYMEAKHNIIIGVWDVQGTSCEFFTLKDGCREEKF